MFQKKMHEISRPYSLTQKILQNCENKNFEYEMFWVKSHDPVELQ